MGIIGDLYSSNINMQLFLSVFSTLAGRGYVISFSILLCILMWKFLTACKWMHNSNRAHLQGSCFSHNIFLCLDNYYITKHTITLPQHTLCTTISSAQHTFNVWTIILAQITMVFYSQNFGRGSLLSGTIFSPHLGQSQMGWDLRRRQSDEWDLEKFSAEAKNTPPSPQN